MKTVCFAVKFEKYTMPQCWKASFIFLATDLLFAQTIFGKAVPFATAGDCYSAARCPQVFHICLFFPHYEKINGYCFS